MFYGGSWTITGLVTSVKITKFQVRCTSSGTAPHTPQNILIALTKTGDFVPATTWHSFALTADGLDYDEATIDFSSEVAISAAEAASGLIGILVDWSAAFLGSTVDVGDMTIELCQSSGGGSQVAYGLGYGQGEGDNVGTDEYVGVVSGGMYAVDGDYSEEASAYHWSGNLNGGTDLANGKWQCAQFGDKEYWTMPAQGVFYRPVSILFNEPLVPLYQDYLNPGSNGNGSALVFDPGATYPVHPFISGSDTASLVSSSGSFVVGTPTINVTTNCLTIPVHAGSWTNSNYLIAEIDLLAAADFHSSTSGPQGVPCLMPYLVLHFKTTKSLAGDGTGTDLSSLGFGSDITRWTINFSDGTDWTLTHSTGAITAKAIQRTNPQQQTDFYVWFNLQAYHSAPYAAFLQACSKIRIGMGIRGGAGGGVDQYFRLQEFILCGQYYHLNQPATTLEGPPFADPSTDGDLKYAFNYTEAGAPASAQYAHALTVPAASSPPLTTGHLGLRSDVSLPYQGSFVSITIPQAPVPFTASAKLNAYRSEGTVWQRIQQQSNTGPLVFTDVLTDHDIRGDTTTYPVTSLTFGAVDASASGQATGVINLFSWAGVMVYLHLNGKAYFSKNGDARIVEWEGVNVNMSSMDALTVPRALQISDSPGDPALVGVANGPNGYFFTRKDGYVMVIPQGGTPATASFPRSISGVRGAVGVRAACRYLSGSLLGSDDGLWYVVKWDTASDVPDVLKEVTMANRGLWADLIGDSTDRTDLIVRQVAGDIWCLCQDRFIHINKDGFLVYGEWADGSYVEDAHGDPFRGLVLQFADGSLSLAGQFVTDRGTNLAGDNGAAPAWSRRGKRFSQPFDLKKIRLVYENTSGELSTPAVRVTAFSDRGTVLGDSIDFTATRGAATKPFAGGTSPIKPGGQWWEIEISGSNYDKVTEVLLIGTPASPESGTH